MILTMERVIHPGWLTRTFESLQETGEWAVYHQCLKCGEAVEGASGDLLEHTRACNPKESFYLELHQFRVALHGLDLFVGLEALEWPDRLPTEFFPLLRDRGLLP